MSSEPEAIPVRTLAQRRLDQGLTEKGLARKRKWAPRKKTGCLTCRARRVKCDEGRPVCRRCIIGTHPCNYDPSRDDDSAAPGGSALSVVFHYTTPNAKQLRERKAAGGPKRIYMDLPPPSWDYLEAIQYYYTYVEPVAVGDFAVVDEAFQVEKRIPAAFVCWVTCHALCSASRTRGRLLLPGEDPAFAGTWAAHTKYTLEVLKIINDCIQDKGPWGGKDRVLGRIADLLVFDVDLGNPSWYAHVKGFLAYIPTFGGFKRVQEFGHPLKTRFLTVLIIGIFANTTCPATKQITGFDDYNDDQLHEVYTCMIWVDVPCPPGLFLAIHHASQLRRQIATGRGRSAAELERATHAALDEINDFDPDSWVAKLNHEIERGEVDEEEVAPAVARAYQAAALAYAVMTLPVKAVVSWAHRALPEHKDGTYEELRASLRAELLRQLRHAFDTTTNELAMGWPLAVLGVASGGRGPEREVEQAFVSERLYTMWLSPVGTALPFLLLKKLRPFWEQGRTEWDDCYDEPVASAL